METRTSTSTQASHRQQHHTLRLLRRWTRLRIHAKTKQRRSRPHNPLQQGRNRHTRQHDRDLPMVQPAKRQRTQPNRSTTQNDRTRHEHRMVRACITGSPECMPMHRAVPVAAERPRPDESIPPGQSTPRGGAGRPRPDFAPRGIAISPRDLTPQMPPVVSVSTDVHVRGGGG